MSYTDDLLASLYGYDYGMSEDPTLQSVQPVQTVEPISADLVTPPATPTVDVADLTSSFADPMKELTQRRDEANKMIDGLTAERSQHYQELNDLNTFAEESTIPTSVMLAGVLGGLLGGGGWGVTATTAANYGKEAYNNLEAQEKQRREEVAKKIVFDESSINDWRNFGQTLDATALNQEFQNKRDLATGAIVGSAAYNQKNADAIANQRSAAQANADIQFNELKKEIEAGYRVVNGTLPLAVAKELEDPAKKAAWTRKIDGNPLPGDNNILSPDAIMAAENLSARSAYGRSVDNTQAQRDLTLQTTDIPGYINTSGLGMDKSLNGKRAEILSAKNIAVGAYDKLIESYNKHGTALTGPEAMEQAALSSEIFAGARQLAQTGMRLEGREAMLVQALSAPNVTTENAGAFIMNFLQQGGDFAGGMQAVRNVLALSFDAKLAGYGKATPEFAQRMGLQPWGLTGDAAKTFNSTPVVTPTPLSEFQKAQQILQNLRSTPNATY